MKVAAVVPMYPPRSLVGSWLTTHLFLRELATRGHEVTVVPFMDRPGAEFTYEGVKVLPQKYRDAVVRSADVVVSHLGDGGRAHRLAVSLSKKSVVMVHGHRSDPTSAKGAALLVCNSLATADTMTGHKGPVMICHPPTDPSLYRTKPGEHVTLVNLSAEKGGDLFWKIAARMPKVPFLGVTGGYGMQVPGNLKNVTVIPPTLNMRDDVYAKTRVLLMPSTHETWGMAAVEAMASGIPVLAKPTPGLVESLGAAGQFCEGNVDTDWVQALTALLEARTWKTASKAAVRRSAQLDHEGSLRRFADALEDL